MRLVKAIWGAFEGAIEGRPHKAEEGPWLQYGLAALAGDCVLHAWSLDNFAGTLKDAIGEIRGMDSAAMGTSADFTWRFDSCPENPKGLGQVVLIPPGYVVARVSTHFVSVSKSFGTSKDGPEIGLVRNVLQKLFTSFPTLKAGAYEAFENHLRARSTGQLSA